MTAPPLHTAVGRRFCAAPTTSSPQAASTSARFSARWAGTQRAVPASSPFCCEQTPQAMEHFGGSKEPVRRFGSGCAVSIGGLVMVWSGETFHTSGLHPDSLHPAPPWRRHAERGRAQPVRRPAQHRPADHRPTGGVRRHPLHVWEVHLRATSTPRCRSRGLTRPNIYRLRRLPLRIDKAFQLRHRGHGASVARHGSAADPRPACPGRRPSPEGGRKSDHGRDWCASEGRMDDRRSGRASRPHALRGRPTSPGRPHSASNHDRPNAAMRDA